MGSPTPTARRTPTFPRTTMQVTIAPLGERRTSMQIQTVFPDRDAMQRLVAMGMEEGLTQAVGQIDAILEEVPVR